LGRNDIELKERHIGRFSNNNPMFELTVFVSTKALVSFAKDRNYLVSPLPLSSLHAVR
jgi:hypothetical protein